MICTRCNVDKPLSDFYVSKEHKNGVLQGCKQCRTEHQREEYTGEYHKQRRESLDETKKQKQREYFTNKARERRKREDVRLKEATRARIYNSVKDGKDRSTEDYIGCSIEEYKQHIESQFTPEMSWHNWGTYWEIDHIVPLSKGGTFDVKNTQPLLKSDNRKKSSKMP